ncbi:MAG: aldehyde dehydrogenase family protein [Methylophagaceae bacterium]
MTALALKKQFSEYEIDQQVSIPDKSSHEQIDEELQRIYNKAKLFTRLTINQRIALVEGIQQGFLDVAQAMVKAECEYKGLSLDAPAEAEAWALGPTFIIRQLRLIKESLQALKDSGNTKIGKVGRTIDKRLSVNVFPANAIDSILFKDVTIDVHMQSDVTEDKLESQRAKFYKQPDHDGQVVLILGAGNIAAIPVMDVLTKMFNEGSVCILKLNPVNAYTGKFIEQAFSSAIEMGFLAIVYGGINEGQYLTQHDHVDEVHITGSDKAYNNIVWGPEGSEQAERIARNNPVLTKKINAELGNVTPVIVVPGPYTDKELAFQTEEITSAFTMNASFLCCVPVSLVTSDSWDQRDDFLNQMERSISSIPTRKAYYPGASDRWHALVDNRDNVTIMGKEEGENMPWALMKGLSPNADEDIYSSEPFCPVLSETSLNATDTIEFLDKAVEFVNNKLWGTLTANLIVHPESMKNPQIAEAVERAITRLKYGVVTINGFNGMAFASATAPWGAHQSSTPTDIQSGSGWVHNSVMLEGIEKAVMRWPITSFPRPAWHPSHKTSHKLMRKLTALEKDASWTKVPGVVFTAMKGG